jgi:hypothetical protein
VVAITDVQLFANNQSAFLDSDISAGNTSLTLVTGQGAGLPSPAAGQYFLITIQQLSTGDVEVLACTNRTGDVLTVERAQEGTTALAFTAADSIVQMRVTKGTLDRIMQKRFTAAEAGKFLRVQVDGEVYPEVVVQGGGGGGDNAVSIERLKGASWAVNGTTLALPVNQVPVYIKEAGTIRRMVIVGGPGYGSAVIDVRKSPTTALPPTPGYSICGATKPTITSGVYKTDLLLTGWDTAVAAGDVLSFVLESVSVFEYITIVLYVEQATGFVGDHDHIGFSKLAVNESHTAGKATAEVAITSAAGVATLDPTLSNCFNLELTENVALTLNNGQSGQLLSLLVYQNGTGGYTLSFAGTNHLQASDLSPFVVSADPNALDHLSLRWSVFHNKWLIVPVQAFV